MRVGRIAGEAPEASLDLVELPAVGPARGTVLFGHAMMVDRQPYLREDRPTLVATLRRRGCRVVAINARGRGQLGPAAAAGGDWSYDDLVRDVPAQIEAARRQGRGRPVVILGHSLYAHCALAALGLTPSLPVEGLVALAASLWIRPWDGAPSRWWRKMLAIEAMGLLAAIFGYVPVRLLGLGRVDESRRYWRAFQRWAREGRWTSDEGIDYGARLAGIEVPVLHVLSPGDRLFARPVDGRLFTAAMGPNREVLEVQPWMFAPPWDGWTPDHMGLALDPRAQPVWDAVAQWIVDRFDEGPRDACSGGAAPGSERRSEAGEHLDESRIVEESGRLGGG